MMFARLSWRTKQWGARSSDYDRNLLLKAAGPAFHKRVAGYHQGWVARCSQLSDASFSKTQTMR
jgi:hypothetical protein